LRMGYERYGQVETAGPFAVKVGCGTYQHPAGGGGQGVHPAHGMRSAQVGDGGAGHGDPAAGHHHRAAPDGGVFRFELGRRRDDVQQPE